MSRSSTSRDVPVERGANDGNMYVLYYVMSCYVVSNIVLYYIILLYIFFFIMLYYMISCYIILGYVIIILYLFPLERAHIISMRVDF